MSIIEISELRLDSASRISACHTEMRSGGVAAVTSAKSFCAWSRSSNALRYFLTIVLPVRYPRILEKISYTTKNGGALMLIIFFQFEYAMCSSRTSVRCARVAVRVLCEMSFKEDQRVSRISPSTMPMPGMYIVENRYRQVS